MAIASLGAVPFSHASSGDSVPFLLDTRNYDDSTPLFSIDTRAPDVIANTGIIDSGGTSFIISMEMLKVTGGGTITFTLVTAPVHGKLLLSGTEQGASATFTQPQIDSGLLSYQRAAGDPLSDTFEVAAMDDDAGPLDGNLRFAVAGVPRASGSLFLVDTRNYDDSTVHTVHTDKQAYVAADSVLGSLRQAIANAAAGTTVDFDAGLSGGTIRLGGSQLLIDKNLDIDASALTAPGIIISGNDASRVFKIGAGHTVNFINLTLTEGSAIVAANPSDRGGAIFNLDGNLTCTGCTFSSNAAVVGGALFNTGTLILVNTTVSGNSTTSSGGALLNENGTVTLRHVTISGNTANSFGGGIDNDGGTVNFENSIIADNSVPASGSGPDISNRNTGIINPTGFNLIGDNDTVTSEFVFALPLIGKAGNLANPLLEPLGNYGGPTKTMAVRHESPAINSAAVSALTTDQRGFARDDGTPDIGAYEFSVNASAGYVSWERGLTA